jgi:hypothetical protein
MPQRHWEGLPMPDSNGDASHIKKLDISGGHPKDFGQLAEIAGYFFIFKTKANCSFFFSL